MTRRITLSWVVAVLACLGFASAANAGTPTQLVLDQSAAFSLLGHSCGGIQEKVYATGFATNGLPTGDVYMQTSCGGSGRGGGYKSTTYSAWATVTWDWFGGTRSYAKLEGPASEDTSFSAEDAYGDRIYNVGTSAYLETGTPPLQRPAAPTGVTAQAEAIEIGEEEEPTLRFTVAWTPASETAALITSSTVTATPVDSTAPVLTTTVSGPGSSTILEPLQKHTTYAITVTSSDSEATSEASAPIEVSSSGSAPPPAETCEQNSGTIKLSPGLSETAHVQSITVKGRLSGCDGPAEPSSGSYVAHLKTTEAVTCETLSSLSMEPTTTSVSLVVKWSPSESGTSHGALLLPITEAGAVLSGTLEGGPFNPAQSISAASVWESFTGGPSCGVHTSKHKAKPVQSGTFATSAVNIGT
jgi:hypothetical protein